MSSVTFSPTTLQIPVVNPGQGAIDTATLTLIGSEETLSLAITDAPAGAFTAKFSSFIGAKGEFSPSQPMNPGNHNIQINFDAPAAAPPDVVTGTLIVSWPGGGSASLPLVGTTAQITATQLDQPPEIQSGAPSYLHIQIDYVSGDATTLDVNLTPSNFPKSPPAGVTIDTAKATLKPVFIKGVHKLGDVLSPNRSTNVTVKISADATAEVGTHQAFINISSNKFPQLTNSAGGGGGLPVMVTFVIPAAGS
jgi:hypothetical protein